MKLSPDFRARVLAREWLCGTFLNFGSPLSAEMAGHLGFDWLLLDHEHGPGGEDLLRQQLQAVSATPAYPIVRIAMNETPRFKRTLDLGAGGIMVPYVRTAAEVRAAVQAMRYPPHGIRGIAKSHRGTRFGLDFADYYAHAHERLLTVIQIETPDAVASIDEIAAVDGADVLFVGPTDLSYTLGIPDQFETPRFLDVLKKVRDAAHAHKRAAGILLLNPAHIPLCRELGYSFVALGGDGGALRVGLEGFLESLRGG